MRGKIPLMVVLLLTAGVGPVLAQNRVPASVWRQTVGQQRLRFDDGDSDGNRNRAVYQDDRYYSDADSDSDSDSDSDGGRTQRVERFPSGRYPYPSDYPSDRDERTQGGVGGVLRDVILGRPGGGGMGGATGRASGGIGGVIERARTAGQVRRDPLPTANRTQRGGVGGVLDDVVRSRAGESAGAALGRLINGLLVGSR